MKKKDSIEEFFRQNVQRWIEGLLAPDVYQMLSRAKKVKFVRYKKLSCRKS